MAPLQFSSIQKEIRYSVRNDKYEAKEMSLRPGAMAFERIP